LVRCCEHLANGKFSVISTEPCRFKPFLPTFSPSWVHNWIFSRFHPILVRGKDLPIPSKRNNHDPALFLQEAIGHRRISSPCLVCADFSGMDSCSKGQNLVGELLMISLMSIRSQDGGFEWRCSKCQQCWDAQDPFSGCPHCWGAEQQKRQTGDGDLFSTERAEQKDQSWKRQDFTCHLGRLS